MRPKVIMNFELESNDERLGFSHKLQVIQLDRNDLVANLNKVLVIFTEIADRHVLRTCKR